MDPPQLLKVRPPSPDRVKPLASLSYFHEVHSGGEYRSALIGVFFLIFSRAGLSFGVVSCVCLTADPCAANEWSRCGGCVLRSILLGGLQGVIAYQCIDHDAVTHVNERPIFSVLEVSFANT